MRKLSLFEIENRNFKCFRRFFFQRRRSRHARRRSTDGEGDDVRPDEGPGPALASPQPLLLVAGHQPRLLRPLAVLRQPLEL